MKKSKGFLKGNLKRYLAVAMSVLIIAGMNPAGLSKVYAETSDSVIEDEIPVEDGSGFSEETDSENSFDASESGTPEDVEEDTSISNDEGSPYPAESGYSEENADDQSANQTTADSSASEEGNEPSELTEDTVSDEGVLDESTSEEAAMTGEQGFPDEQDGNSDGDDPTAEIISITPTIVLSKTSFVYNGKNQRPYVTVKNGDEIIPRDCYALFYQEETIDVGSYSIEVWLKNGYEGSNEASYKITPKNITPSVTLSKTSFIYNGKIQKPSVTVKDNNSTIPKSDYTVSYPSSSQNAGTYKVTVKLKGNYSGTATASFMITPKKVTPSVTLSKTEYVYNGKVQKPSVTVKLGGTKLAAQNYTLTYPKGLINVGTYTVTVKLKGNYSGSKAVSFKISPKPTSIISAIGSNDKISVKWKKQATQITGYQLQYSQNKNFTSGNKTATIAKPGTVSKEISKPAKGKNYYVRIRTYKKVGTKTYYSSWSKAAYTAIKQKIKGESATNLYHYSWESPKQVSYTFTTTNRMILVVPIKATAKEYISKGGVRIILEDSSGNKLQNDLISMKGYDSGDYYEGWFYADAYYVNPGTYTYTIKNTSDGTVNVKYSIISFLKYAITASIKDSVTVKSGNRVKIGKINEGFPYGDISFSDKSVLTGWNKDVNGTLWVYANKKGTSTVTVKLQNGNKYTCKVTATAGEPNFFAEITGYYTRDNYFEVKVKNLRSSDLTIIRKGAKVINVDYKEYDRDMKSGDNVIVKSGETKYIKFYIKGDYTWTDYRDFTLYAKMSFEGVSYEWHVWDTDSVYKENNSWWSTYWNENAYNDWRYE